MGGVGCGEGGRGVPGGGGGGGFSFGNETRNCFSVICLARENKTRVTLFLMRLNCGCTDYFTVLSRLK